MENPASWTHLEHTIHRGITRHHLLTGFGPTNSTGGGRSIEGRIAEALYYAGLLRQQNAEAAQRVISCALGKHQAAMEAGKVGLSAEKALADALRAAKLVEERVESEVEADEADH